MAIFGPFEYVVRDFACQRPYRYSPPPVVQRKARFVAKPKRERMLVAQSRRAVAEYWRQHHEMNEEYLRILREGVIARRTAEPFPILATTFNDPPRQPTLLSRLAKLIGFSRD